MGATRDAPAITSANKVTVISAGELAVIFDSNDQTCAFLNRYRILRLTPEVAYAAAAVDRELIGAGVPI